MTPRRALLVPALFLACSSSPPTPLPEVDASPVDSLAVDALAVDALAVDAPPAPADQADGAAPAVDAAPDAGDLAMERPNLAKSVGGDATIATAPRSAFGALAVAGEGKRIYAVESRRDVEPGPFGIPWRVRFRLAAYDDGVEAWSHAAEPDDVVSDVAVHPSGEVTIAVLRQAPARRAYDLVRFDREGVLLETTTLAEPATIPLGDYAAGPRPLFGMKAETADATEGGWVRLLADGEGLIVAFLSHVDAPPTDPASRRLALGLATFARASGAYVERWARVVDGPHAAQPAAWTYDELRWREQAIRPFLARDDSSGELVVGRAWNNTRCSANVTTFAELAQKDCVLGAVSPIENEWLPLAVTRFAATGARLGTRILVPE